MGISSSMTGSPWHKERMHRADGDERRHRSNCVHYRKSDKYCVYKCMKCDGSAHCKYYKRKKADVELFEPKQIVSSAGYVDTTVKKVVECPPINVEINQKVFNKTYGVGVVRETSDTRIMIDFNSVGLKPYIYPDAFHKGFLVVI